MAFTPRNGHSKMMAEINVTPLVDVMLVLLIIFMITAPMMSQGVDVDLPEVTASPLPQKTKPVIITITGQGQLTVDRIKCDRNLLQQKLAAIAQKDRERPIFLNADRKVPYGMVVVVMADVKEAGFDNLGMMTKSLYDKAGQVSNQ